MKKSQKGQLIGLSQIKFLGQTRSEKAKFLEFGLEKANIPTLHYTLQQYIHK